jgi:hypothetical protein
MKCKDCRHFVPAHSISGVCNIELPVWFPQMFGRAVSTETGCDLGESVVLAPRGRGRPRKQVEENDNVDE